MVKFGLLVKNFFSEGHERTLKAKKNIVFSFFIKCGSILISLLTVPLSVRYVNPSQYGVWLTLSALFIWFSLFDIGFGNGLKNKLTQAIAENNYPLARIYVSTTYFIVALISLGLFCLFLIANHFLDWTRVLNTDVSLGKELGVLVLVVFSIFSVQFVLQLLNIVCLAKHNTIMTALIGFTGNLLGLAALLILTRTTHGSLLYLSLSIGVAPLLALLIFSFILFAGPYKELSPSFRLVKLDYAKDIMSIGIKFFIIQIGLIFYYNCDNLIITQTIGPQAVTPYNIAFRYFNAISMISTILMTPFWPAFTEANAKGDFLWISNTVKKLERICFLISLAGLFLLLISPVVYHLWLGNEVIIPFSLSAIVAFYTVLLTFRTIYCYYMNGIGKISLQLYLVVISGIINIPLAIFLCRRFGAQGVLMSTTLLCIVSAGFEITQYRKLITNTATGIWNK